MARKASASANTPVPRPRARRLANPFDASANTSQMLGLSLGDLRYTTLFEPVPTEDELPPKRAPSPRQPAQCTIGYTCHDVLVDGRRQSQRIPTLRLSGQWPEALGFAPGSKLQIAIVDGALVIKPMPEAKVR